MYESNFWLVFRITRGLVLKAVRTSLSRPNMNRDEFAIFVTMNFAEGFTFPDPEAVIDVPAEVIAIKGDVKNPEVENDKS